MTADVELLPLYAELQGHPKLEIIKHYARANVEHHTEALRAEVRERDASLEWWGRFASGAVNARKDAEARAERLAEALREAKETMLSQVKWEACDCGCPQGRKPADAVSVTWLRAVQQVEIATARAEEGK